MGEKNIGGNLFIKTLKFSKFVADLSIAQEIQDSNNFSGVFNTEFDNCMTQLTIFWLKCNEQHSGISTKSNKNTGNVLIRRQYSIYKHAKLLKVLLKKQWRRHGYVMNQSLRTKFVV